jgi:hypothetical protein
MKLALQLRLRRQGSMGNRRLFDLLECALAWQLVGSPAQQFGSVAEAVAGGMIETLDDHSGFVLGIADSQHIARRQAKILQAAAGPVALLTPLGRIMTAPLL